MTSLQDNTNSAYRSRVVPAHGIERRDVQHHPFLILAIDGGDRSAEQSSRFTLKEIAPKYPLNGRLSEPPPRPRKKVNQSHYRPEVPRGFQEVKVPRLSDNGPGWW